MVYTNEMVALLQQLRTRILAEFGVRIRLADPELLDSLAVMGRRSRDRLTVDTISRVLELAGISLDSPKDDSAEQPAERRPNYYRGQPVENKPPAMEVEVARPASGSKRVYRGQVVHG